LVILVAAPLLAFGPVDRTASTHWALIIGISDYINLEDVEAGTSRVPSTTRVPCATFWY